MRRLLLPLLILLCFTVGCDALPPILGGSTPEPTALPISPDELLTYRVPLYTISLQPGDTVPGTQLQYVGRSGDVYQVKIDGLATNKRGGDSFAWRGITAPGVSTVYNLRLTTELFGGLTAAGTVDVMILNPTPTAIDASLLPAGPADYSNILVSHTIPQSGIIPGTTLQFVGVTNGQAQIGGRTGYPYVSVADSLDWLGRLRDNVIVRYSLRITRIEADALRTDGTVELWILD
jgi:hypothetical protein